jgi:hypothetical protein
VALVFAAAGLVAGLRGDPASTTYYFAAGVLGISGGAVLVDELRLQNTVDDDNTDAWLGTLCLLGSLAGGAAGFVLGLMHSAYATTWSTAAILLAILAMGAMVDELRLLRSGEIDFASAFALTLGVVSFSLGFVGFMLGIAGRAEGQAVLLAAIVVGITAVSTLYEADHRSITQRRRPDGAPHRRMRRRTTAAE